jgi:hypothetical protein
MIAFTLHKQATDTNIIVDTLKTGTPHISSKLRRRARRTFMRAHVSRDFTSHLLAQDSSGAVMCPVALAPAS